MLYRIPSGYGLLGGSCGGRNVGEFLSLGAPRLTPPTSAFTTLPHPQYQPLIAKTDNSHSNSSRWTRNNHQAQTVTTLQCAESSIGTNTSNPTAPRGLEWKSENGCVLWASVLFLSVQAWDFFMAAKQKDTDSVPKMRIDTLRRRRRGSHTTRTRTMR